MANTTFKWTARWVQFYFSSSKIITKVFTRSVRVKYVVCSPTKGSFEFDWITIVDSLKVILFSCYENYSKNFTALNIKAWFNNKKKSQRRNKCIYKSKVWYVQCWAKRLTLNFIEFIHSQVWRSFDSLAVKSFMHWTWQQQHGPLVRKIQRLSFQNW